MKLPGMYVLILLMSVSGCVAKKDFIALQKRNNSLARKNRELVKYFDSLQTVKSGYDAVFAAYLFSIDSLQKELALCQNKGTQPGKQAARVDYGSWNDAAYRVANTAAMATYLTDEEKEFYKLWNYLRLNPQLFLTTYLKEVYDKPAAKRNKYEQSLVEELMVQKPLPVIMTDKNLFTSAKCHAYNSGKIGLIGHDRTKYQVNCPKNYRAECCSYGNLDALGHLKNLMIDNGVPSLGHRRALLGDYKFAGVSIQPHKTFTNNIVIDMHYLPLPD